MVVEGGEKMLKFHVWMHCLVLIEDGISITDLCKKSYTEYTNSMSYNWLIEIIKEMEKHKIIRVRRQSRCSRLYLTNKGKVMQECLKKIMVMLKEVEKDE